MMPRDEHGFPVPAFDRYRKEAADNVQVFVLRTQHIVFPATGMLITALHHSGLATLTHTPAPMRFLNKILDRPSQERPYLILVTGYPTDEATVPQIEKKPLSDIARFIE